MLSRAESLRGLSPHFTADIRLYRTEDGGKKIPALTGWGCPCMLDKESMVGWDAWPLLGDTPLHPGDERRLGFVTLTEEGFRTLSGAEVFHLWEGRFIGEATLVSVSSWYSPTGGS